MRDSKAAVRVESHKVAIVTDETAELAELGRDETIRNCGEYRAPIWASESESAVQMPVSIWLAGSTVNMRNDLVFTAFRIRDALKARAHASPEEIVWDLGGSEQHEALCGLIGKMRSSTNN